MENRWAGIRRVAVMGNGGGGKTTLAHALKRYLRLPCHEVDQIQFRPGWERTPTAEVEEQIERIIDESDWIIDGFGPWPTIERRAECADLLVFVDFPLWVHFWWVAERQLAAARGEARLGGPEGCPLSGVTQEMFRTIGWVDQELTPKLRELMQQTKQRGQAKVLEIHSPAELDAVLAEIKELSPE